MKIQHRGKAITLTQDAYLNGGAINLGGGSYYNGDWYEASGEDADGNEYRVIWTDIDTESDDASDHADWNSPDYVFSRGVEVTE